jgi:hypothetical protein
MKERSPGDEVAEVQEEFEDWLDDQVCRAEGSFETGPSQKLLAASHERQDDCPSGVVWGVTLLGSDLMAMGSFLQQSKPIMIVLRPVPGHYSMVYGFVDAPGEGFGGLTRYKDQSFRSILASARIGFWCNEISEKSSNFREFRNLKEHVKAESRKGNLAGRELWVYTDNEVTERAWFNGTSSKKELYSSLSST